MYVRGINVNFVSSPGDPIAIGHPDAGGRAGWIVFLQQGGTLEQVENLFLTSPEYISHIDVDYVQSLYLNILGRPGSPAEVAQWNNNIQNVGGLVGVANGFDALVLALRGFGVGKGDEVIVSGHTFIATWLAILQLGGKPVPVDQQGGTTALPSAVAESHAPILAAVEAGNAEAACRLSREHQEYFERRA